MHTAICSFDDKDAAHRARERLVQAGFDRHDVHIEHRHVHGDGADSNDRWDGLEREVAVSRTAVKAFGHFFASLFGEDNASGHTDTYSQHVERGSYVVVVDGHSDSAAMRAQALMHEMEAGHTTIVNREGYRPMRDILAERGSSGTAGMADRGTVPYESTSNNAANLERERAMARDADDASHAPGLRYADKDKPLG
jgi:hypothetical protein